MEIRRGAGGDIYFYDDNGDLYNVIYKRNIDSIQREDFKPFHPMCRCSIIPIVPNTVMVFMPYVTKSLIQEYIRECKESVIWRN